MSFGPPAVTGYSAFFDPTLARPGNGAEVNYNAMTRYGRESVERLASFALSRSGFRGMRRAMRVLNGAAPGAAAGETYTRVTATAPFEPVGGLRQMEVVVANSGNTTAAQRDYLNNFLIDMLFNQSPAVYPPDLSGNGGGGKAGV
jgi:hypothetical protein